MPNPPVSVIEGGKSTVAKKPNPAAWSAGSARMNRKSLGV
jgi:hypothetical protein